VAVESCVSSVVILLDSYSGRTSNFELVLIINFYYYFHHLIAGFD